MNADSLEITKFDALAQGWWDPAGELGTLHTINPLRVKFILEKLPVQAPNLLDVGCGGGILAEALARSGAQVTAIDLSQESLAVARQHAKQEGLHVDYRQVSVEQLVAQQPGSFDTVTCMEMLEHVPDPRAVIAACAQALKPGGHAFFSTIDRTPKAFLFAIIGGEYVLRLLPRGSHTYQKFIRPRELKDWAADSGLTFVRLASLSYNPFTRKFRVAANVEDVNYMVHFVKH